MLEVQRRGAFLREREREIERDMADTAVEFLLNNLKDLLIYHANLSSETNRNIESLQADLRLLQASLKVSLRSRTKNELTKAADHNIREAIYEADDVIDDFVIQKRSANTYKFWKSTLDFSTIAQKIQDVKRKVEDAKIDLVKLQVVDEDKSRRPEVRQPRLKDVVGFEEVTAELIGRLIEKTNYFDVVCLNGMFGLGKTTLAWKIFNDQAIVYEFPVRIWLSISQEFSDKDIFLSILEHFTNITDEIRKKDKKDIAQLVAAGLETKSFLIVMDDVWTRADWERLKYALPSNNTMGKVLITSRIEEVGKYACNPRHPHRLRFFTQEESWELLQLEALGTRNGPPELEIVGNRIARGCKGIPLAVVVIGGFLATKYSPTNLSATEREWEKVSEQVGKYLNDDPADHMNKFIDLSYDTLPYHLRLCFLYLGMFLEAFEIPASKLILMWIAEGFVQQSDDSSLEETGEKYLEDLINRNLVMIEQIKFNGKVKTVRIHDALRDFCRKEAAEENFLQEIKFKNGVFTPNISNLNNYRRLSIHSHFLKFLSSEPNGPRVRSFVCFTKDKLTLPPENIPHILKAFKKLRVLDVECIQFPKINKDLFQLVHVRYLVLAFNLPNLPSRFSELWNLQTLIVDTTSTNFEVKADIWKLIRLRHFKTNVPTILPKPSKDNKHGEELQTLGTVSVKSCTTELFQRASNLKKLSIRGQLALLLDEKKGSFDRFRKMENLENLKLINDVYPHPASDGKLNHLPPSHQFPYKLKSLTLRATYLDWSNMSILGSLAHLEVLKLKDKAFMGNTWVAVDGGFPRLEVLLIKDTDLEVWGAFSRHYPKLRELVLRNCEKLIGVPVGLADTKTFRMLELYTCKSAVSSAKKIREAKIKAEATFKLSIFPPTD